MSEEKVALEAAEAEFERFTKEWEIDSNSDTMTEEAKEAFSQYRARIINGIMLGKIVITESGDNLIFTLGHPLESVDKLVFRVPKASAYLAMDSHKDKQGMHKMNTFLGQMTKQAPVIFSKLDSRDIKTCHAVASLFLVS